MLQGTYSWLFFPNFALFKKGNSLNEFLIFRLSLMVIQKPRPFYLCCPSPQASGTASSWQKGQEHGDTCFLTTWPSSGTQPLFPFLWWQPFIQKQSGGKFWQRSFWLGRHFPEQLYILPLGGPYVLGGQLVFSAIIHFYGYDNCSFWWLGTFCPTVPTPHAHWNVSFISDY